MEESRVISIKSLKIVNKNVKKEKDKNKYEITIRASNWKKDLTDIVFSFIITVFNKTLLFFDEILSLNYPLRGDPISELQATYGFKYLYITPQHFVQNKKHSVFHLWVLHSLSLVH